ncbi:MAG: TolC family protein [Spirochaetota bacterium]
MGKMKNFNNKRKIITGKKIFHASEGYLVILFIFLAGLFLSGTSVVHAQTLELTLDEAIQLGVKNSTTLESKRLAVEAARAEVQGARSSLYPQVSASASWTHLFEQPRTEETTFYVGSTPVTVPGSYTAASDPVSVSADLSQTIYSFGQIKNSVQMAARNVELKQLEYQEEKRKLAVEIKKAFYGYLLATRMLELKLQTLDHKQQALDIAGRRYDAGVVSDYEVLKAEADLASFRPELVSARNEVEFSLLAIKDLLGIEDKKQIEVNLVGKLEPTFYNFSKKELVQKALSSRYEVVRMGKNLEISRLQEELAQSKNKPTIAAFAGYTLRSGFDPQTGENKYWGEDSWDGDLSGGISVRMPVSSLFPWSKTEADQKKAALDIRQLSLQLETLGCSIRLTIENILLRLEKERTKIESSRKAVQAAEKLYNSSLERYKKGVISSNELKDAQINLASARLGYLSSIYNHKIALFDLMNAVGVEQFERRKP